MNRKAVAIFVLAFWFILTGIDFLQDADLIEYSTTEMDRSVEDALDNFGEAVRPSEAVRAGAVPPGSLIPYPFFFDFKEPLIQHGPAQVHLTQVDFPLTHFKLHKFNEIFLI
jgi:hypothetical protein